MKLVRITAPHFVAGMVHRQHAAPIIAYMLHWPASKIRQYCTSKGWSLEVLV